MEFGREIVKYQIQSQKFEHDFKKCILNVTDRKAVLVRI